MFEDFKKKISLSLLNTSVVHFASFMNLIHMILAANAVIQIWTGGDDFWTNVSDFNICDEFEDEK